MGGGNLDGLYFYKYFLFVHPVQNVEFNQQYQAAFHQRGIRQAKYFIKILPQMDVQRTRNKGTQAIGNNISRNRIHADYH